MPREGLERQVTGTVTKRLCFAEVTEAITSHSPVETVQAST